jgi:hypothetical protein
MIERGLATGTPGFDHGPHRPDSNRRGLRDSAATGRHMKRPTTLFLILHWIRVSIAAADRPQTGCHTLAERGRAAWGPQGTGRRPCGKSRQKKKRMTGQQARRRTAGAVAARIRFIFDTECRGFGAAVTAAGRRRSSFVQWTEPIPRPADTRECLATRAASRPDAGAEQRPRPSGRCGQGFDPPPGAGPGAAALGWRRTASGRSAVTLAALLDDWAVCIRRSAVRVTPAEAVARGPP